MAGILSITKKDFSIQGEFRLPYSKSESNRALIIKALFDSDIQIKQLSEANDTLILEKNLNQIQECSAKDIPMVIDVKDAGTVMRFLTALLAVKHGRWFITGNYRMKERPIKDLVDALVQLGAEIHYSEKLGYPPLTILGKKLQGGKVNINASISSQFITALIMIAPTLPLGLIIELQGDITSKPYIMMTVSILEQLGIKVQFEKNCIIIQSQHPKNYCFRVSPDWTAASYAYELVALSQNGTLFIPGLKNEENMQGDCILPKIYKSFGVTSKFSSEGLRLYQTANSVNFMEYDFKNYPDLAQTVIATCVGLNIQGKFKGLQSLKIKETDRIEKMNKEFSAFGFTLKENNGEWHLKKVNKNIDFTHFDYMFQTYGDHRMAMSLLPLVLKTKKMKMKNPDVVIKSFPTFWNEIEKLGFELKAS